MCMPTHTQTYTCKINKYLRIFWEYLFIKSLFGLQKVTAYRYMVFYGTNSKREKTKTNGRLNKLNNVILTVIVTISA